jgi:hypothetical protein
LQESREREATQSGRPQTPADSRGEPAATRPAHPTGALQAWSDGNPAFREVRPGDVRQAVMLLPVDDPMWKARIDHWPIGPARAATVAASR